MAIKIPTSYNGMIGVKENTFIRPSDWAELGDTLTLELDPEQEEFLLEHVPEVSKGE